jgi:hypothetical protein
MKRIEQSCLLRCIREYFTSGNLIKCERTRGSSILVRNILVALTGGGSSVGRARALP